MRGWEVNVRSGGHHVQHRRVSNWPMAAWPRAASVARHDAPTTNLSKAAALVAWPPCARPSHGTMFCRRFMAPLQRLSLGSSLLPKPGGLTCAAATVQQPQWGPHSDPCSASSLSLHLRGARQGKAPRPSTYSCRQGGALNKNVWASLVLAKQPRSPMAIGNHTR